MQDYFFAHPALQGPTGRDGAVDPRDFLALVGMADSVRTGCSLEYEVEDNPNVVQDDSVKVFCQLMAKQLQFPMHDRNGF